MNKIFLLAGLLLFTFAQVVEASVAGRFQFVNGDVKVVAANGKERSVSKGSEVSEGESVVTSPSASAQIKMEDDGLIVVRPDTKLRITTFLYSGKTDGSERSFISLFKGGFRAITGAIGRVNKDNYKIETPTATIGIRGTDHEATFIPNPLPGQVAIAEPGTYDKVNSGAAVLSTANGMIVIKPDQAGFVPNIGNAAPKILATIPAFLRMAPGKDEPKIVPQAGAGLKEGTTTNPNQPNGTKGGATSLQPIGAKGALTPLATGGTGTTLGTAKTLGSAGVISTSTTLKSGALLTGVGTTAPVATTTLAPISTSKSLTTTIQPITTIQPVTTTIKPITTTIQPITTTIQPITTTIQPITTTIQPITTTIQPITTTIQPITTTIQPITTTIQPITTTIQPITTTIQPVTTTIQPITTTIQPITTTIQPITTFSDRRLKTHIKRIGTHHLGIGIYEFDYVWGEHAKGVMADEVKTVMPEAVTRHPSGYDMVDYSKLQ